MLSFAHAADAKPVGVVFEMSGAWLLGKDAPQKLSKGHEVPAGGTVYIQSPTPGDSIVILDNNGGLLAHRRCRVAGECERPIVLPQAARPRPSSIGIMFDSVMKLLLGEPDEVIHMRSRGIDVTGVVLLSDGKLDLGPVLTELEFPAGEYYLRMRDVARGEKAAGEWLRPFALKWDKSARAPQSVAGLRPGLYELAFLNYADGVYMPSGSGGLVLVTGAHA
jgi:hypothetical protein